MHLRAVVLGVVVVLIHPNFADARFPVSTPQIPEFSNRGSQ